MTDTVRGCFVAFTRDIRTDDVEHLVNAIKMIKGVAAVELQVNDVDHWTNLARVRSETAAKIMDAIHQIFEGKPSSYAKWKLVPIDK
jgi:hypothetical protein